MIGAQKSETEKDEQDSKKSQPHEIKIGKGRHFKTR